MRFHPQLSIRPLILTALAACRGVERGNYTGEPSNGLAVGSRLKSPTHPQNDSFDREGAWHLAETPVSRALTPTTAGSGDKPNSPQEVY